MSLSPAEANATMLTTAVALKNLHGEVLMGWVRSKGKKSNCYFFGEQLQMEEVRSETHHNAAAGAVKPLPLMVSTP